MSVERLTFEHLRTLYSAWRFDVARNEAVLTVTDDQVENALKCALGEAYIEDSGLTVLQGDPEAPLRGQTFRLAVAAPRVGLGVFAPSMGALLQDRRARVAEPPRLFLIDADTASAKSALERYRAILKLVNLLAEAAAYLDREHAELVFIDKGKIIIPVDYTDTDVVQVDPNVIEALTSAFEHDLHREQKLAILAEVVIELVAVVPLGERFPSLLRDLPKLQKHFSQGYRLFASSFSYEKIKNEVEEARLKYTTKIHDALAGIQNQLLGIPVATLVVATQLRPAAAIDATFWANSAVLTGVWVFVLLVNLLIRNQQKTLAVLEAEIDRQHKALRSLYSDTVSMFEDAFTTLLTRAERQQRVLHWICVILFIGLAMAHVVFFAVTEPAQRLLFSLWS